MLESITLTAADMQALVEAEIVSIYHMLQQGGDVSPGRRLRLEGKVELLMQYGLLEWAWLETTVASAYVSHFGQPLPAGYWQWLREDNAFRLPVKMQDAPVYKGSPGKHG